MQLNIIKIYINIKTIHSLGLLTQFVSPLLAKGHTKARPPSGTVMLPVLMFILTKVGSNLHLHWANPYCLNLFVYISLLVIMFPEAIGLSKLAINLHRSAINPLKQILVLIKSNLNKQVKLNLNFGPIWFRKRFVIDFIGFTPAFIYFSRALAQFLD